MYSEQQDENNNCGRRILLGNFESILFPPATMISEQLYAIIAFLSVVMFARCVGVCFDGMHMHIRFLVFALGRMREKKHPRVFYP